MLSKPYEIYIGIILNMDTTTFELSWQGRQIWRFYDILKLHYSDQTFEKWRRLTTLRPTSKSLITVWSAKCHQKKD